VFSVAQFGSMLSDTVRMSAYVKALRGAVEPGAVVLDIGTGTGFFALLACRLGARRVYALEPNNAIQVAREMAQANGYDKRIEFIQKLSSEISLPEPADVMISDLRGVLPLFGHHLPSIIDARERLLSSEATLIPQQDTLWAAVAEAPDSYLSSVVPFDSNPYELDMQAALPFVTNKMHRARVASDQLLVEPKCWGTLDYRTIEGPNLSSEMSWVAMRAGVAHGLSVWFDATLAEDITFSNAPGQPALVYGQGFFPWAKPVPLATGDIVSLALQANLIRGNYVWRWHTCVVDRGHSENVKADFNQSTFGGAPFSPEQLRKRGDSHVPALNEAGQINHLILSLMDGRTSLGDIARRVSEQFPSVFATWHDALMSVSELSRQYSSDTQ
jgi:type I protein arginine methyltransferase